MSCLSDLDIIHAIENKQFVVTDVLDFQKQIQPASFDLRLGSMLRKLAWGRYDLDYASHQNQSVGTEQLVMDSQGYLMMPGEFLLAHTIETIMLDHTIRGVIHNKSTPARMGLSLCNDSAFVDPGFSGQITLELNNNGPLPIKLRIGAMICQLELTELKTPCGEPYGKPRGSHYCGQRDATPAALQRTKP